MSTSAGPSRTPRAAARPGWVAAIENVLPHVRADQLTQVRPPADVVTRPAAVLIQFSGIDRADADVLLIERSSTLRSHPGQAAFPGGAVDPTDATAVTAALREAQEETGLLPGDVELLGTLPELWLPPSGFAVTPVVGWMPEPAPVRVNDPQEVARVQWLRLDALLDPRHRFRTRHPSGYLGPAFDVDGLFVWGFTAGLLSRLLDAAGLTVPWDVDRIEPLPARYLSGSRSGSRVRSNAASGPPVSPDPIPSPAEDDSGVEP